MNTLNALDRYSTSGFSSYASSYFYASRISNTCYDPSISRRKKYRQKKKNNLTNRKERKEARNHDEG